MAEPVRITFLGGLGDIGRNCAVLESDNRMVILDCGQMFSDETQPGVESIIPDFRYLIENADRIEGCIVTHAHEDHIGGLTYLLEAIPLNARGHNAGLSGQAQDAVQNVGIGEEGAATEVRPLSTLGARQGGFVAEDRFSTRGPVFEQQDVAIIE